MMEGRKELHRQLATLKQASCDRVFEDQASGAD